jgi:hypothetical protein
LEPLKQAASSNLMVDANCAKNITHLANARAKTMTHQANALARVKVKVKVKNPFDGLNGLS